MADTEDTPATRRQRQAVRTVLIALAVAFCGAMLGVVFGVALGEVAGPEAWIIGLCAVVTGGLLVLLSVRPDMATGAITGTLAVYFVFHLNVGAILAFRTSQDIVLIVPYIIWFFPLVIFHQFTNLGFHKRAIGLLVSLGPVPVAAFVLGYRPDALAIADIDAIVTFLVCFAAFILFVGIYARHRDAEVLRAAMTEEAQRSAEVLRVSEERFRLLGRATNDLIWDADLKSGRIWWNDRLHDIYGYDAEALGTNMVAWESWVHPDDRARVTESLQSAMDSGSSNWTSDYRFVCVDGRTVDVVDRGLIVRDDSGTPIRMIGSTADVTELRALERKLRQSQKMEAIGQLTGGVAHDFNNLLTIIIGNSEILAEMNADDPKARRLSEATMQAAERGAMLTSRLLSFARRQALEPRLLDPGTLLRGIEGLVRHTINESIAIDLRVAHGIWPIEVDPNQLENAILNLVINARDAMPKGGRLSIDVSNVTLEDGAPWQDEAVVAGRYVLIDVADNGCGMPPEVMERAFEPFFTTKEAGKGSGLGLSMVWGFVQQSNGYARISSELRKGTSVKLYFPAMGGLRADEAKPGARTGLVGGTERILVVEDDALVRRHVVTQLRDLGYDITETASASEALAVLESGAEFDLLFTDVVIPGGLNGRQLADTALWWQPTLKLLFTSGYTQDAIVHHGRLDPGTNLLGKPYRRAELAAMVRRALDE
ncbi:MAG: PAS domain-containing protein [Paracoccaceae bacterium]|nr:MAG: PAS domain-containing protein [Paracoccaceae bacterium]